MIHIQMAGIRNKEDALMCVEMGVDIIGLLVGQMHTSDDFLTKEAAKVIKDALPKDIKTTLITHLESGDKIIEIAKFIDVDYIQLHSHLDEAEVEKIHNALPDKKLLRLEVVLMILSTLFLVSLVLLGLLLDLNMGIRLLIIIPGFIQFLICAFISIWIEQKVGYYECPECNNRFIPTFAQTFFVPHMGRTRHLKCPKCGKKSWCKKVFNKD